MSDLTPEDMEFVRDYAERNAGYPIVGPVVDFINHHLAPPRIIRTVEELEALDSDTVVQRKVQYPEQYSRTEHADVLLYIVNRWGTDGYLPAIVIRDGAEVRAARKALEEG